MREGVNVLLAFGAALALHAASPGLAHADDEGGTPQGGENRWVPSLAVTSGITLNKQKGSGEAVLFEDMLPPAVPLQGPADGSDLAVSPFVGAVLEVMSPALPIPTRPRPFLGGEILPTFAADRDLALDGDPSCVRGPEPDAPCATMEPPGVRTTAFGENEANGTGVRTTATIDTLVYGASLGVAFPVRLGERQLRIKPAFAWMSFEVETQGLAVNAACDPTTQCTPTMGNPMAFLRQPEAVSASDSRRFNGIGPAIEIEMDTGRFGPLGSSIFLGGRAYYVLGDRTISYGATQDFDDQIGMDTEVASFSTEVNPWMFRAHVGFRVHWLGSQR